MRNFWLVAIILFFGSCGNYYGHVIESDYSYDGSFGQYNSYDFIADKNFEGSQEHKDLIEKYLGQTMDRWGYEKKDRRPNLLIFYKLYYDDFKMKAYSQPDFEQWVNEKASRKVIAEAVAESSFEIVPNVATVEDALTIL